MSNSMPNSINSVAPAYVQEILAILIVSAVVAAILLIVGLKTKKVALSMSVAIIFLAYGSYAYVDASSAMDTWEYAFIKESDRQLIQMVLMTGYISWILAAIVMISSIVKRATKPKSGEVQMNKRPKFCINCGAKIDNEVQFCSECGRSVGY